MERTPPLPDKEFFSMGETCRIAQVPSYTLRYWEAQFGCLRPTRRSGGHRRYSRGDLDMIFSIKDLVQRRRMTIEGARKALSRQGKGDETGGPEPTDSSAMRLLREVKKEIRGLLDDLSR